MEHRHGGLKIPGTSTRTPPPPPHTHTQAHARTHALPSTHATQSPSPLTLDTTPPSTHPPTNPPTTKAAMATVDKPRVDQTHDVQEPRARASHTVNRIIDPRDSTLSAILDHCLIVLKLFPLKHPRPSSSEQLSESRPNLRLPYAFDP